jgi:CubicO group peptidase (beta-lactamase class C family)
VIFSCTKGVMTIAAYELVQDGLLDLDAPVARYWPQFDRAGKGSTTVRQVLSHRAGLPVVDQALSREEALSWDPVIAAIEAQPPLWPPGTAHTYHAKTFGWLIGEVIRRITGLSPGAFVRERLAEPLALETWIGLPPDERANVAGPSRRRATPGRAPTGRRPRARSTSGPSLGTFRSRTPTAR